MDLGLKDAGHMRELSRSLACPAPIVDIAHAHLLSAKAKGRGHLDWGAVGLSVRDAGGLPDNSSSAS